MTKIFISYRRDDSKHAVGRLHAALKPHVKNSKRDIFIDIDNIPNGVDFVEHLESQVSQCDVMLAVIGANWLSIVDPTTGQRRLDDPDDFVRIEVSSALRRGIPVVPVVLDGTPIPRADELPDDLKALSRRNSERIDHESFNADVARLVAGLPKENKASTKQHESNKKSLLSTALKLVAALVFAVALAAIASMGVYNYMAPISLDETSSEPASMSEPFAALVDPNVPGAAPDFSQIEERFASKVPESEVVDEANKIEQSKAIRRLQSVLKDLKFYDGEIDGEINEGTFISAELFALEQGLSMPNLFTDSSADVKAFAYEAEKVLVDQNSN